MSAEHFQPKPEIIHLDQQFQLFNPQRTLLNLRVQAEVPFILVTGVLPDLEVHADVAEMEERTLKTHAFTPFSPEAGYIVTPDDMTASSRKRKLQMMDFQGVPAIDYRKASLDLWMAISPEETVRIGLADRRGHIINPTLSEIIKRLRLQLSFPNEDFEALPDSVMFEEGDVTRKAFAMDNQPESITFDHFYPLNSGPLAVISDIGDMDSEEPGLRILVRPDIQELSQIRGRFDLVD